ncbi:MAG: PspC domain-containing protein [Actinomycetota bacterium]
MTTTSPPRRLYRSRSDRMLGGVAGGVASYLQVDPALTRLAFAALALAAGAGLLLYVIAWIVIPEEPAGQAPTATPGPPASPAATDSDPAATALAGAPAAATGPAQRPGSAAGRGARLVAGTVLVTMGTLFLLDWAFPDLDQFLWPAALIALGLGLLAYGARR